MRTKTIVLAASLLIAFAAVPTVAADVESDESSWRCDGVVINNQFTGNCSANCYGEIYINGNWFASYTC